MARHCNLAPETGCLCPAQPAQHMATIPLAFNPPTAHLRRAAE